ncbi:hypothetical protein AYO43_00690 [Nitrospira sp. SCGC AG-212-E16]|nr:hypothetical protein AYO43_00690 [Nitrospira sp. SCGC AG-212-E16]
MLLLALLSLTGTACGTTAPTGKILFEGPSGAVSLQTLPDRSFYATHPLNLEPALVAQVLKGMEIKTLEVGLQRVIDGSLAPVPAFSGEQIQFLAPLLAQGLRMATPNQFVAYRVETTYEGSMFESTNTETTAGSLYAYGRQLFVTLSQWRFSATRERLNVRNINYQSVGIDYSSGLKSRVLLFTPSAAQRPDSLDPYPDPGGSGSSAHRFIAVDYELLQQAWRNLEAKRQAARQLEIGTAAIGQSVEAARAAEARAQAAEAQARTAEAQARNTEALSQEVETLKKQLESIQKQLGSQPTGKASPK